MRELVDLHIHSFASDGTNSPEEIVKRALSKNMSLIALTDHNTVENSQKIKDIGEKHNIRTINGTEINANLNGLSLHILALGIDIENSEFLKLLENIRNINEDANKTLINLMSKDYLSISLEDYEIYTYNKSRGAWKAVNYLVDRGIIKQPKQGQVFYEQYDCAQRNMPFPSIDIITKVIKSAGGIAILAHPGLYTDYLDDKNSILTLLDQLKSLGIDGVECFYPYHSYRAKNVANMCMKWCKQNNMQISGGCDFHGAFIPSSEIGKINIYKDQLILDKIL